MKPYYSENGIKIYHCDMRAGLSLFPEDYFALAAADPPYGIGETGAKNSTRGNLATASAYGHHTWDLEKWDASHFEALMRASVNQIIWGGNYYSEYLPSSPCWLFWDKDNGSNDFADGELAWGSFPTAARMFRYRWNGMLQQDMTNKERRVYPTQKPKALYRWIYQKYAKQGQRILDPCFGSGASLRAAFEMGLEAVGMDKNEAACEIAAKRLRGDVPLFDLPFTASDQTPELAAPVAAPVRYTE